jgi:hypothetical protein
MQGSLQTMRGSLVRRRQKVAGRGNTGQTLSISPPRAVSLEGTGTAILLGVWEDFARPA